MNEITTKEVAMLRRRVDAARLDEAITRASESLVALQHPDGHWVFELEADATIPSRIHPAPALFRPHRAGTASADRQIYSCNPRRGRRLAAVPRRRARSQRFGQGLFRAEGGRRSGRCAAYGTRPGGDPGPRRRPALQRLHPHPARIVRRGSVAGGPGHAGRDHAAAELVSLSHRQGVLLVAHGSRAAARADGAAAAGPQPARYYRRRAFSRAAGDGAGLDRRSDLLAARRWRSACSTGCCGSPSRSFRRMRDGERSTKPSPLSPSASMAKMALGASFRRWPTPR